MDPEIRVIDYIKNTAEYVKTRDGSLSSSQMLDKFLFPPREQYSLIKKLSGGEKRRLNLLRVLMEAPNVLILDEPTNDLDIKTLTILEDYLDSFDGIVIAVSHDRYFLDRVVDRIFAFEEGGQLTQYEGGYSDYRDKCVSSIYNEPSCQISKKENVKTDNSRKASYNSHETKLKFSYMEQKEYESIDDDIEKLENEIARLDEEIVRNTSAYSKLVELTQEKEKIEKMLEEKMDRWEYLNELADKIEKQKTR